MLAHGHASGLGLENEDKLVVVDSGENKPAGGGAPIARSASAGVISELPWPDLSKLELLKVNNFPRRMKVQRERTIKDEHHKLVIENSPYGRYIGPAPIVRTTTPAEIAARRMSKIRTMLGLEPKPGSRAATNKKRPRPALCATESPVRRRPPTAYHVMAEEEFQGPETLETWRDEADRLRVALNQSLSLESQTGRLSYPLLQEAPVASQRVKDANKGYQLPTYVHQPHIPPPADGPDTMPVPEATPAKLPSTPGCSGSVNRDRQAAQRPAFIAAATPPQADAPIAVRIPSPIHHHLPSTTPTGKPRPELHIETSVDSMRNAAPSSYTAQIRPFEPAPAQPVAANRDAASLMLRPSPTSSLASAVFLPDSVSSLPISPSSSIVRSPSAALSMSGVRSPLSQSTTRRSKREMTTPKARPPSPRARLHAFLNQLDGSAAERVDDSMFAALPELPVSSEMQERMKDVLEKHLGQGPWQDIVASTLARPLEPLVVYCEDIAKMDLATVGPALVSPELGEEPVKMRAQTMLSETVPVKDVVPKVEYLRRLAEHHEAMGEEREALECLQKASSLLEAKEVIVAPVHGALFPYTNQVIRAARTMQRAARRRFAVKQGASTRISACFKGYVVRRERLRAQHKQKVAAKIIQERFRIWMRWRGKHALRIQKVFRGHRVRKEIIERRQRNLAATHIQALIRTVLAKARVRDMKYFRRCIIKAQAIYRGHYVRLMRYMRILAIHTAWARGITEVTKHVRGALGRAAARAHVDALERAEFDRQQIEDDLVRAGLRLALQRHEFYLQTAVGHTAVEHEKQRMMQRGQEHPELIPAAYNMWDMSLLREALRPLFGLVDVSSCGYVTRQELQQLMRLLDVSRPVAEAISAMTLTDDRTQRNLDFTAFCKWYQLIRRNSVGTNVLGGPLTTVRTAANHMKGWFAARAILQRHSKVVRHRLLHQLSQVHKPPHFTCCSCRKGFLRFRAYLAHFTPLTIDKRFPEMCPVTGTVGVVNVGLYGDRALYDLQKRVHSELMRGRDEEVFVHEAACAAESEQWANLGLPQALAEMEVLTRAVEAMYRDLVAKTSKGQVVVPVKRSGVRSLSAKKRKCMEANVPRSRKLAINPARAGGFTLMRNKQRAGAARQKARPALPIGSAMSGLLKRAVSAIKPCVTTAPCPERLAHLIFDCFRSDLSGVAVEDFTELCSALCMRFKPQYRLLLTDKVKLYAAFVDPSTGLIPFDTFYDWYRNSCGRVFVNNLRTSAAGLPRYVARVMLMRRAVVRARHVALTTFRQARSASLYCSDGQLALLLPHTRRHPELRGLLEDVDTHRVERFGKGVELMNNLISDVRSRLVFRPSLQPTPSRGLLDKALSTARNLTKRWKRVKPNSVAVASELGSPGAQWQRGGYQGHGGAERLSVEQADAEMMQHLRTPYGRHVMHLLIHRWQCRVWQRHRDLPWRQRGSMKDTFLKERCDFHKLDVQPAQRSTSWRDKWESLKTRDPAGMARATQRSIARLPELLLAHDFDDSGALDTEAATDVLNDLDAPVDLSLAAKRAIYPPDRPTLRDLQKALKLDVERGSLLRRRKTGTTLSGSVPLRVRDWWQYMAQARLRALARGAARASCAPDVATQRLNAIQALRREAQQDLLLNDAARRAVDDLLVHVREPDGRMKVVREAYRWSTLSKSYAKTARADKTQPCAVRYHFDIVDSEQTGRIDSALLGPLLHALGTVMSPQDVTLLTQQVAPGDTETTTFESVRTWFYSADARVHRCSRSSRMLQLGIRISRRLPGRYTRDAVWGLQQQASSDARQKLRLLLRLEDGDLTAIHDIMPWHRRKHVTLKKDVHGLLMTEASATADGLLLCRHSSIGTVSRDERRYLNASVGHETQAAMKSRQMEPTEALTFYTNATFSPAFCVAASGFERRFWMEKVAKRLGLSAFGGESWASSTLLNLLSATATEPHEAMGEDDERLAQQAGVDALNRSVAVWARSGGKWKPLYLRWRLWMLQLGRALEDDDLVGLLTRHRSLARLQVGLSSFQGKGARAVEETEEVRAMMWWTILQLASEQGQTAAKVYMDSVAGRQDLDQRSQQLKVICAEPVSSAAEAVQQALNALNAALDSVHIELEDVHVVMEAVWGRSKQVHAMTAWVVRVLRQALPERGAAIGVHDLADVCTKCSILAEFDERSVDTKHSPRFFAEIAMALFFRRRARAAVCSAVTADRLMDEWVLHSLQL